MPHAILAEEDRLFRDTVRSWVDAEIGKDWCRALEREEDSFPHDFWDKLCAFGAHGIGIPEEYGGQGGSIVTQVLFARELARTAAGVGWVWGVTSFSGGQGVLGAGSEGQKQRFLPEIAAGRLKTAMAFTEAGGGTDLLGGMQTTATRVGGGWRLKGERSGAPAPAWPITCFLWPAPTGMCSAAPTASLCSSCHAMPGA